MSVIVQVKDGLSAKRGKYEVVLTNPPFGKKSSVTIVNEAGESSKESLIINRDDFWASTSTKQLIPQSRDQHLFTILKQHGRAAVVVPDNVLFEGGAGETIRRELLKQADVHTLLRQRANLDEFVVCYSAKDRTKREESERWKSFPYEELLKRDSRAERDSLPKAARRVVPEGTSNVNLDITWLKDESLEDSANLPDPDVLALEIVEDLEAALAQFAEIAADLKR